VVLIRCSLAAATLWLVVLWRQERVPGGRELWFQFLLQGLTATVVPYSLISWGQLYVDSALSSVLNSASPLFVFLFTAVYSRHEAATALRLFGVVLGLGGTTLIIGVDALSHFGDHVLGEIAIMVAAVFYALSVIFSRRFREIPTAVTSAATLTLATLFFAPVAFTVEDPLAALQPTPSLLAAVLLGLVSTAFASLLYYRLINTIGPMNTSTVSYLRAGVSVLIGVVWLDEPFTWMLGLGLVAVIAGVACINKRPAET
jgi:drug/metabolite transporter (DMT)-like permease